MKKLFLIIFLIGLFISCDEELSASEKARNEFLVSLDGTWEIESASVDGTPVTKAFQGLAVTFTRKRQIAVANPVGNIWPASSTFIIGESPSGLYELLRSDDVPITVTSISATALEVAMDFANAPGGGRVSSVAGSYEFRFLKQ